MDGDQLAALAAVIEAGSFDAAAERLRVTPSAISQRIKSLEQRVGQVLVVRQKPCTATLAAVPLLRLAAQTAVLEAEALAEMGGGSPSTVRVAIAVNADSMATWFASVFERLPGVLFDIRIEDQDHSARLLRDGSVMGAVTTERAPIPGCRVHSLGRMRYLPVASESYLQRWLPEGFTAGAAAVAPSLAWNRADALQDTLVRGVFRRDIARPTHFVPTAEGFAAAGPRRPRLGDVPRGDRRPGDRCGIVRPDLRCPPRRPTVLAVLETGQPPGQQHHLRGRRSRCRITPLTATSERTGPRQPYCAWARVVSTLLAESRAT